ncbi:MAG: cohesin domain-containing protein [Patescibacteria group bacterium]|nr:cohesin domain-containing protein [Patescibacteria group bacterium]
MKIRKIILFFLSFFIASSFGVNAVSAGPRLYLEPSSGNFSSSGSFEVEIKIDSGQEEIMATDTLLNFDSTKLEIVSVADGGFFEEMQHTINSGLLTIYAYPKQALQTKTGVGVLAKVTFRAVSSGTATASFLCQTGSDSDSNIWTAQGNDVIDCASNGSGSYTLGDSPGTPTSTPVPTSTSTPVPTVAPGGSTATPTSTPVSTSTPTPTNTPGAGAVSTSTPTSSQLPETGVEVPGLILLLGGGLMVLLGLAIAF